MLLFSEEKDKDNCFRVVQLFSAFDTFIITSHMRADGDAIAAICFVSEILRQAGKTVFSVIADPVPDPRYGFLAGFNHIQSIHAAHLPFSTQVAVVLDSPTLDRIGKVRKWVETCSTIICIDHHPGNDNFASVNLIDTHASSTCEILANLSAYLPVEMNSDLANTLYAGILFDTGNFRFSNTTGHTLRTSASLIDLGANPEYTSIQLFNRTNLLRVRAMAQTLQSIELLHGGKIAVSHLPHSFFSSRPGADKELEGFSDLALSIEGVCISIFMRETAPGDFKISLRSVENWDVASVADLFGGGGHRKASGCKLRGEYAGIVSKLLDGICQFNPLLR
jgi:bifunctional oligoribonuclease and PAP phosphatase NrnA